MDTILTRVQNWYKINCNGDWEHSYGFAIATLDNPGWTIKIDLHETALENLDYKNNYQNPNNEFDWYQIKSDDGTLKIGCGPDNFEQVLTIFLDEILPNYSDSNFYYDIYLPLIGYKYAIWSPAKGKLINEKTIELTEILPVDYKAFKVQDLDLIDFAQTDLDKLTLNFKIGDIVQVDLVQVFDGLILTIKK
jgi:hypothetical protein